MKNLLILSVCLALLSGTCETPSGCPDCNCPDPCNDTVTVKGYAFQDITGTTYTNDPITVILAQQNWILYELKNLHDTLYIIDTVYIETGITPKTSDVGQLVSYWKFNNASDETGRYPLTYSAPGVQQAGFVSFDGSGLSATPGVIPIGDRFTISFWFRTYNTTSTARFLFGTGECSATNGFSLCMDEQNKSLGFYTGNGNELKYILSNDNAWTAAAWNKVLLTADCITGEGKIYINGTEQTRWSSTGVCKTFTRGLPFVLGRSSSGDQSWACLDEIKIYNYILNDQEINTNFIEL